MQRQQRRRVGGGEAEHRVQEADERRHHLVGVELGLGRVGARVRGEVRVD